VGSEEEEEERVKEEEEEEEEEDPSLFSREFAVEIRRKNWKRKENCFLTSLSLSAGCRSLHGSHCF
jgi:hypothetical protein